MHKFLSYRLALVVRELRAAVTHDDHGLTVIEYR